MQQQQQKKRENKKEEEESSKKNIINFEIILEFSPSSLSFREEKNFRIQQYIFFNYKTRQAIFVKK